MSAEHVAEKINELITDDEWATEVDEPIEDVKSGGYFFDLTVKGKHYEVLVTEWVGSR
jgi:hypothetical protein